MTATSILSIFNLSSSINSIQFNSMANIYKIQARLLLVCICIIFICSIEVLSKSSRRPISDTEIREKKQNCYAEVELGYWGAKCKSSMVEKENCALQCLSPACYELIYESDPLEEGERDYVRSQEYKYCMHRLSLGESLEGVKGSFE